MKIDILDALCGAGKTYRLARYAHEKAQCGARVLFVQPSKRLIEDTIRKELSQLSPVPHRAIHGDTDPFHVRGAIIEAMSRARDGEILFVTHSAFLNLGYVPRHNEWTVIIDEVPAVDIFRAYNLPETHSLITSTLEALESDARYCVLRPAYPQGESYWRKIECNVNRDEVWALFQDLAHRLMSPDWTVYALDYQLNNLRTGHQDARQIITYSLLKPSVLEGFKRVVIAGACVGESILYRLWSAEGVEFNKLDLSLRYTRHENGELITIYYGVEGSWSKHLRDREIVGERVLNHLVEASMEVVGDQPFVFMANRDEADPFAGLGERLPNTPHGLNTFQDRHAVVILSALNVPPPHFAFLASKGVAPEEVKDAGMRQTTYQAVNRISIRDPSNRSPKTVVVPDAGTADWLSQLFPGSRVQRLPGMPQGIGRSPKAGGRPRRFANGAEQRAAHRRNERLRLLAQLDVINGTRLIAARYPSLVRDEANRMCELASASDNPHRQFCIRTMSENRPKNIGVISDTDCSSMGSIFADKHQSLAMCEIERSDDDEFIAALWAQSQDRIATKDAAGLVSPAMFDPTKSSDTDRGLDNIRYLRGIWIDFDGGDLTPAEFARIFPRLRIVTFNTYSSTPANLRWRAFIPTTYAMPVEVHGKILNAIVGILREHDYHSAKELERDKRIKVRKTHGIDTGKFAASSMFYLPCRAADPEGSFFYDHNDGMRGPLDPYHWAQSCIDIDDPDSPVLRTPIIVPPTTIPTGGSPELQAIRAKLASDSSTATMSLRAHRVADAVQEWREVGCLAGHGDSGFFRLGAALASAGLSAFDITSQLKEEAAFANSPRDRLAQVSGVVRSLAKRGSIRT